MCTRLRVRAIGKELLLGPIGACSVSVIAVGLPPRAGARQGLFHAAGRRTASSDHRHRSSTLHRPKRLLRRLLLSDTDRSSILHGRTSRNQPSLVDFVEARPPLAQRWRTFTRPDSPWPLRGGRRGTGAISHRRRRRRRCSAVRCQPVAVSWNSGLIRVFTPSTDAVVRHRRVSSLQQRRRQSRN